VTVIMAQSHIFVLTADHKSGSVEIIDVLLSVYSLCWILFNFVVYVSHCVSYFKRESKDRGVN
jgi:hypothetical protein